MTGKAVKPRASRLPIEAARERVLAHLGAVKAGEAVYGPAMLPCVCGRPRHEHAGPARTGKCEAGGCSRYRHDLVDSLAERALRGLNATLADDLITAEEIERRDRPKPREGGWNIGPSDAGGCRAAIGFRERGWGADPTHRLFGSEDGAPEGATFYRREPEDYTAARMGTVIHADVLRRRKSLYPWRQYGDLPGMSIAIAGLDRHGRFDEYDPITTRLVDVKTAGSWKWDVINESGPDLWQWRQLMIYGLALVRRGDPVGEVEVLYVERAGGRDLSFVRAFDESMALEALSWLITTAQALDLMDPLPRDRPGPSLDSLCRRCFARSACWEVPQALAAGRSPESWVRLGADPRVDRVAALLAEYDEARERASAAEADKKAVKVYLDGVRYGTYGDYKYGFQGGNAQPPVHDAEQRVAQLQDAMHEAIAKGKPPVDPFDLPFPMREKTSPKSVRIKRLTDKERRERDAMLPEHLRQPEQPAIDLTAADGNIVDGEIVEDQAALPAGASEEPREYAPPAGWETLDLPPAQPAERRVVGVTDGGMLVESEDHDGVEVPISAGVQ